MKYLVKFAAPALAAALIHPTAFAKSADIVVLMDESGSMSGEQSWIAGTIPSLDGGLVAANVVDNRYGLIGFSAAQAPAPSRVRSFDVGGGQFGSAAQFTTAAAGLAVSGATEDGWAAINAANGYSYRGDAVRNYILITDEDRDNTFATTAETVLASMTATKTLLNVVVNATFQCGDGSAALGMIGSTGYTANGSGGFSKCSGASTSSSVGTTFNDYISMALATGGGAWNLNVLRSGGDSALSFTAAFIDGKVGEIIVQPPIPEPSTYALMACGLGVVGWIARRRKSATLAHHG